MTQVADQMLPTLEVCGSNPVVSKILYRTCLLLLTVEKTKYRKGPLQGTVIDKTVLNLINALAMIINYDTSDVVHEVNFLNQWDNIYNHRYRAFIRLSTLIHTQGKSNKRQPFKGVFSSKRDHIHGGYPMVSHLPPPIKSQSQFFSAVLRDRNESHSLPHREQISGGGGVNFKRWRCASVTKFQIVE